jgi:Helix-turn-helix domain
MEVNMKLVTTSTRLARLLNQKPIEDREDRICQVIHGANDGLIPVGGRLVTTVQTCLAEVFNIPGDAVAFVNGALVERSYRLQASDTLEFVHQWGQKGAGPSEVEILLTISQRLASLERKVGEIHDLLLDKKTEKEWYRTDEVAKILGKSDFTVREKWCNQGRIEAVKDEATGKWRIPGHELQRLRNGGGLRPSKDN